MNLLERYASQRVTSFRLWITSDDGEVFQVNCDSLVEFKNDPDYMGVMQGTIEMKDWVLRNINVDCEGWPSRIRMLLVTDGAGVEKAFKILSDQLFFQEADGNDESVAVYKFRCREDIQDEST